jgi:uncharacterized protein
MQEVRMARIVHFEIHASDPQAAIAFYGDVFGWKFTRWGEIDYGLAETGPADRPGIDGGLVPRRGPPPGPQDAVGSFACTIEVASLDGTLVHAQRAGATVALPKMAVAGVGWLACLRDPDGNLFGAMQPDPQAA